MNKRLRKKHLKRPRQIGRCKYCGGKVVAMAPPFIGFVSHGPTCRSLNDADDGYHAALLGRLLCAAKVVGN